MLFDKDQEELTREEIIESLKVENIATSISVNQELDVDALEENIDGIKNTTDNFPGVVYDTSIESVVILLFRSGKMVCTGANTTELVEKGVNEIYDVLEEVGIDIGEREYTVENLVAGFELGQFINLNNIAIALGLENIEYEPEQFPGLVYRPQEHNAVVLLFSSGSCIVTGTTTVDESEALVTHTLDVLEEYEILDLE